MINNNNLYKSENKIPTKSDLEAMIGASIFLIFISTTKSNNPTITRIIAVVGVIAIALLSIAKVTRKQLSPAEVCKYFGVFRYYWLCNYGRDVFGSNIYIVSKQHQYIFDFFDSTSCCNSFNGI